MYYFSLKHISYFSVHSLPSDGWHPREAQSGKFKNLGISRKLSNVNIIVEDNVIFIILTIIMIINTGGMVLSHCYANANPLTQLKWCPLPTPPRLIQPSAIIKGDE